MAPIRIDGRTLEGGGQVLRTSVACSVVLGQAVTVHNIRGGRPKPGLAAQHLKGLEIVAAVCGGRLQGAQLLSEEMTLYPKHIRPGTYHADTETAGSVTLLLQVVLPCALYARGPTKLSLIGGTNADMAPPVEYTSSVYAPIAKKFGVQFTLDVERRGFFPRGGGRIHVAIEGLSKPLQPVQLVNRGTVRRIGGVCYVSGLPPHLPGNAVDAATKCLKQEAGLPSNVTWDIKTEVAPPQEPFNGKGFGMLLWCETDTGVILGSSKNAALGGRKGKGPPPTPAHELGRTVAHQLAQQILQGICIDNDMQNQVIILMGLAAGRSSILTGEVSLHTQTVIQIMQQMTQAKFTVEKEGDLSRIMCDGIGLDPNNLPCAT